MDSLGKDERWCNLRNLRFLDYMDKDDFLERMERGDFRGKLEGILHMGACSDTLERDAGFMLRNNYEYTKRLALASLRDGIRFLYASSAATYGDGSRGFSDDHSQLPKLKPLNIYAYSKHLFDLWALRNDLLGRIAGLKYFNVFGPNEYHKGEMRSVVLKTFEQARREGKVKLFKSHNPAFRDGEQRRDFIYIKDAVDMTLFIYEKGAVGIFNVGTGKARTFKDLALATFQAMAREPRIEYMDMPPEIRDKYQYFTQADIGKLRGLGYDKPTTQLEEAVYDYVRNYLLTDDPYLGKEDEE